MTTLFKRTEDLMAKAAMAEEGTNLGEVKAEACDPYQESLEEILMEVAFAEAADFEDIHSAIVNEHFRHCAAA